MSETTDKKTNLTSPGYTPLHLPGLPPLFMVAVGLLALTTLVLEYGFHLTKNTVNWLDSFDVFFALCFGIDRTISLLRARNKWQAFLHRWFEWFILSLFILSLEYMGWYVPKQTVTEILAFLHLDSLAKFYIVLVQLFLSFNLSIRFLHSQEKLLGLGIPPIALLVGSFGALILIGTGLLLLPKAGTSPMTLLDALFTATSAVCVTGLTVRDTGCDFSQLGQMIILVLFQIGGLGIMTYVAWLAVLSGKSFSVPQMVALREMVSARNFSDVKRMITAIVLGTVVIEAIGAICLFFTWPSMNISSVERWKWSVFHSISAFCNAGFSLTPNSLESVRNLWGVGITMMALIFLGGIGFPALRGVLEFRITSLPYFRQWRVFRKWHAGISSSHFPLQIKLTFMITILLLVGGALGFWLLETNHFLKGRPFSQQLLISCFQSVTPRTAGFNSVPMAQLQDATLILVMMLMVVGASPVSTGGGIKTVTLAVLFLMVRAMLSGRDSVEAFGRSVPRKACFAAVSVFVIYILMAILVTFLLTVFDPGVPMKNLAFEAVSALSTVGLSTGLTPHLSVFSKLILCLAMFVGRVGPLTLFMTIFLSSRSSQHYNLPEEKIVVG